MARNNIVKRALRGTWSLLGSAATCGCVIIVLPFFCVGLVAMKCRNCVKHHSRQGRRVYLASESSQPLSLPLRRRFNISDPRIPLAGQSESRLMSLPYELREKIWSFATGRGSTLDIRHEKGEQRLHYLMVSGYELVKRLDFGEGFHLQWDSLIEDISKVQALRPKTMPAFALMSTCRQVYKECMPIIYSQNTFRFTKLDHVCFFNQGIRRQWAARLRSLSLVLRLERTQDNLISWESACFQMATWMTGLSHLSLDIGLRGFSSIAERNILIPLTKISGLESYKTHLWHLNDMQTRSIPLGKYGRQVEQAVKRPRGTVLSLAETNQLLRLVIHPYLDGEEGGENDVNDTNGDDVAAP